MFRIQKQILQELKEIKELLKHNSQDDNYAKLMLEQRDKSMKIMDTILNNFLKKGD